MARTHKHEMFRRPVSKFSLVEYHENFDEVKNSILSKVPSKYNQNYTPKKRSKIGLISVSRIEKCWLDM